MEVILDVTEVLAISAALIFGGLFCWVWNKYLNARTEIERLKKKRNLNPSPSENPDE